LRDDGFIAEPAADVVFDQTIERFVGLQLELIGGLARVHAHALVAFEILQQRPTQIGIGIEQRRACELDDRNELQRDTLRARLALDHAEALKPRGEADRDQQRDQKKGAPKQAPERVGEKTPIDAHGAYRSALSDRARLTPRRLG